MSAVLSLKPRRGSDTSMPTGVVERRRFVHTASCMHTTNEEIAHGYETTGSVQRTAEKKP
jgi:hypothetical protein